MRQPKEIFGFPTENLSVISVEGRKKYHCPYLNNKCVKQSRTINYPMGVCSVLFGNNFVAICPNRFLENKVVFQDVSNEIFGSSNNVLLFPEVRVNNVGSFDFVLVQHKPLSSDIEDFCIVEFQSDSTTGTGNLVDALEDFMQGKTLQNNYNFGMNTYNTIKLSYIQMLIKGQVMEGWGKNIVWIVQKYVFVNMENRFLLKNLSYDESNYNKYFIYDLIRSEDTKSEDILNLRLVDKQSSTVSNLLTAFTHQPLPKIDDFINVLKSKIQLKLGIKIN